MAHSPGRIAYEGWVRDYTAALYRSAYRLTGRADVAEELVQETFFEAWRSIESLRDASLARPWLMTILRHRYARWVRDESRRPSADGRDPDEAVLSASLSSGEPSPGEALSQRDWLQAGIDALDDRFKVPLVMVFLQGFSCEEVASALSLPLGTVLSRLYRARRDLRKHLAPDGVRETT